MKNELIKYYMQEDEPTGQDTPVEPETEEDEDDTEDMDEDEEVI